MLEFPDETHSRAAVLLHFYRECYGYACWNTIPLIRTAEDLQNTHYKMAVSATRKLMAYGFAPSVDSLHWKGYVEHAFRFFAPVKPLVFQLSNLQLLRNYNSGRTAEIDRRKNKPVDTTQPTRSREELKRLYSQVLDTDFVNDTTFLLLFE